MRLRIWVRPCPRMALDVMRGERVFEPARPCHLLELNRNMTRNPMMPTHPGGLSKRAANQPLLAPHS
jgi:hypothetical protein